MRIYRRPHTPKGVTVEYNIRSHACSVEGYGTEKEVWFHGRLTDLEDEIKLAHLLLDEKVLLNGFFRAKTPSEGPPEFRVTAICSDVFMWGCADAEPFAANELHDIYDHFLKDPEDGVNVWCIKKRGMRPQKPVFDQIKSKGIWPIEEICAELPKNPA